MGCMCISVYFMNGLISAPLLPQHMHVTVTLKMAKLTRSYNLILSNPGYFIIPDTLYYVLYMECVPWTRTKFQPVHPCIFQSKVQEKMSISEKYTT